MFLSDTDFFSLWKIYSYIEKYFKPKKFFCACYFDSLVKAKFGNFNCQEEILS